MDAARFGLELARARARLVESADFTALGERGHQLQDGAVLTSVSEVPFEMSFRCRPCAATFWFENLSWRTGGAARWRLIDESREGAQEPCGAISLLGNHAGAERVSVNLKGA